MNTRHFLPVCALIGAALTGSPVRSAHGSGEFSFDYDNTVTPLDRPVVTFAAPILRTELSQLERLEFRGRSIPVSCDEDLESGFVFCLADPFSLIMVPPGSYRLRATVAVIDEDLNSEEVEVRLPIRVTVPDIGTLSRIVSRLASYRPRLITARTARSLGEVLALAEEARQAGKERAADGYLAQFTRRVRMQRGSGIRRNVADVLLADVQALRR